MRSSRFEPVLGFEALTSPQAFRCSPAFIFSPLATADQRPLGHADPHFAKFERYGDEWSLMNARVEQLEFQAEARQLLDLMVHSVYSNKDSFLRELISNASDALDKLRLEAFRNKDLNVDTSDLHIDIEADKEARTLTICDNGIGMTRDEVVDLIGTWPSRVPPSCGSSCARPRTRPPQKS